MASDGNDHDAVVGPGEDSVFMTSEVTAGPVEVAAEFVAAVAWGEHSRIWELLSEEARRVVLRVAVTRGMDERLAARLRDDTAVRTERDTFLTDLVNGLRADLRGNDLDALEFQSDVDEAGPNPDRAQIMLLAPVINPALGAALPVASMELVRDRGQWRVERLLPRTRK